jgi:PKD repeat protein
MSNDRNPIHNYQMPGTYNVTLSVIGLSGSDSATKTIQVKSPLEAEFIGVPTIGSAPLTVTFTDLSIGTPVTRNWFIIDLSAPSATAIADGPKELVYTFNTPGNYAIWLEVKDEHNFGDLEKKSSYIHVLPFP